jgi:flagellar hook assembly protein FlgD
VSGSGLDAGGSSTMAFEGQLLNKPSDPGGEREVSEGLFVFYSGVYAAPASEPVLSPNGDLVAESQALSYKLVAPANVTVNLIGPDKAVRPLDAGPKVPGAYRLSWNGLSSAGLPEPEGTWRFSVTALDDQGQTSTADRFFALNRTLGALSVSPAMLLVRPDGPSLQASFTLTRPAKIAATVHTASGALFAVADRRTLEAGQQTISWNGRAGRTLAHSGRYTVRITATNEFGRVELAAPFSVRRVTAAKRR